MEEIYSEGPVVAVMRVSPDFYMYNGGVYEVRGVWGQPVQSEDCTYPDHLSSGHFHAVLLIGWGTTLLGRPTGGTG